MSTPGGEQAVAKDNLDKAKKLISDLEKKGVAISEAKGWFDQAQDMFRSGLFRTSIIYSSYALDAANELVQKIKDMVLRVTKVKARAIDMLGADNKNMPKIDELIAEMKRAINEGRLEDCQELISGVDEMLRGGSSPYLSTTKVRTETVVKTAQPSRGYSSCPSCGNITESNWTQCKYCGQDLSEEGASGQTGPSWQSGEGPHLVSDKENEEDHTDEDLKQMERTEEELDKVGTDLDSSEDQMVGEVERPVDERTSRDMQEQEEAEQQMERTEADLEKAPPLPPPLPPSLPPPIEPRPKEQVDEETSTDMQEQEAIESELEKVQADLDTPVEVPPKPEVVPTVEPPKEEVKPPQEPPKAEVVPPEEPPKAVIVPLIEPPKVETPPPAPPAEQKPPPPPPPPPPTEGPKRFFIPPPPKLSFDDIKLPPLRRTPKARLCPNCGEEVEIDFKSCPICKTPLN